MGRGAQNYSLQAFSKEPALYRAEEQTAVSLFRAVGRGETELVLISEVRDGQQRAAQLLASVYDLPFASYSSEEIDTSSLAYPCVNYISVDFDSFSKTRRSLEGEKDREAIVVWGLEGTEDEGQYIHFSEEADWQKIISRITENDGVLQIQKEKEDNTFLYDYATFARLPLVKYTLEDEISDETLRYAFKSGGHSKGAEENVLANYLTTPSVFLLYSDESPDYSVQEVISEYKHPDTVVAFLIAEQDPS